MNLILTLVVLVALAVIGKYFFKQVPKDNIFLNFLNYSGFYYLLMGILFGPYLFNLFTQDVIEHSHFVFSLVLGWTGLLMGLQLNLKQMGRFQGNYFFKALIYFFLNAILIFTGIISVKLLKIYDFSYLEILLLSVAGSMTSTITIALLVKSKTFDVSEGHFLEFLAAFDNVLGVFVLGVLFAVYLFISMNLKQALLLLFGAYFIIFCFALVFKMLAQELKTFERQAFVILSIVLIVVATSKILQNSVLFLSMLLGLLIANQKGINVKKLYLAVEDWEKPLNFILLFFIGVVLQVKGIWLVAAWYFVIIVVANWFVEKWLFKTFSKKIGFQTFGLSTISLAITLDAYLSGGKVEFLSMVVVIYFLTNVFSIYQFKRGGLITG